MIEALKFVMRGVAKTDFIPNLTHFRIQNGRVTGTNGTLTLSAPLSLSFDAAPSAGPFLRSLDACDSAMTITLDNHKIIIKSGAFKASVPCVDVAKVPVSKPEGEMVPATGLVEAFRVLRPFISEDPMPGREFAQGILLSGQSAFACNNPVLVEYWLGSPFPYVANVPVAAIDEVLRVKDEPVNVQLTGSSLTFHYSDLRWIKVQLNSLAWPNVFQVLNSAWEGASLIPVDAALKAACEKLADFAKREEGNTYFRGRDVATARKDEVASVEVTAPDKGCFKARYVDSVLKVATLIDWGKYPQPIPFAGNKLRGCLCGVRE